MNSLKTYYSTIYSIAYSTCGNYLVAGNNYGLIAVFNLNPLVEESESVDEVSKSPFYVFDAKCGPVYSLTSTKQFVVSGGTGEVKLWKWSELKHKNAKPVWTFVIPLKNDLKLREINTLAVSKKGESEIVYAGCGDNNVYCLDMESGTLLFTLEGHTDYIHDIDVMNNDQECISASEDGTVRIWDARKGGKEVVKVEPYAYEKCRRPDLGNWIKCVSLDSSDDWFVCGGGPHLSVWHIRSLKPSAALIRNQFIPNVAHFRDDVIVAGGTEEKVFHWRSDGELEMEVQSSSPTLFAIGIHSDMNREILTAGGSSYKIDLFTDFRFLNTSLIFPVS